MKTTKRELKQIIAEEIKNALKENLRDVYGGGQDPYDYEAYPGDKPAGIDVPEEAPMKSRKAQVPFSSGAPASEEADPLEMLKRVKAMVDKAIADVEASKKS